MTTCTRCGFTHDPEVFCSDPAAKEQREREHTQKIREWFREAYPPVQADPDLPWRAEMRACADRLASLSIHMSDSRLGVAADLATMAGRLHRMADDMKRGER